MRSHQCTELSVVSAVRVSDRCNNPSRGGFLFLSFFWGFSTVSSPLSAAAQQTTAASQLFMHRKEGGKKTDILPRCGRLQSMHRKQMRLALLSENISRTRSIRIMVMVLGGKKKKVFLGGNVSLLFLLLFFFGDKKKKLEGNGGGEMNGGFYPKTREPGRSRIWISSFC